jgi:hypothetical protein
MQAAAICSSTILAAIAAVHFYWAAGGEAGKAGAVPSRNGKALFKPKAASTAAVGLVLLGMAGIITSAAGLAPAPLPARMMRLACIPLAIVFFARAVGDFRTIGFFKPTSTTTFARRDTLFYSPLCLALAALITIVVRG